MVDFPELSQLFALNLAIAHQQFLLNLLGIYTDRNFKSTLFERPFTNDSCHCPIGYVHLLDYLELDKVFGSGTLERILIVLPKT